MKWTLKRPDGDWDYHADVLVVHAVGDKHHITFYGEGRVTGNMTFDGPVYIDVVTGQITRLTSLDEVAKL